VALIFRDVLHKLIAVLSAPAHVIVESSLDAPV
jgi:hypothetical protein